MTKIEFSNGSVIETLETSTATRGKGFILWTDEEKEEEEENE